MCACLSSSRTALKSQVLPDLSGPAAQHVYCDQNVLRHKSMLQYRHILENRTTAIAYTHGESHSSGMPSVFDVAIAGMQL